MLDEKFSINITELANLPLRERFDLIRRLGFKTIEASTMPEFDDREFREYLDLIRAYGFRIASGHDWYHFFTPNDAPGLQSVRDRFSQNLDRVAAMGCDKLIWYSGDNGQYRGTAAVEALAERLAPMLERAKEYGIALLLETEYSPLGLDPSTSIASMEQLMRLVDSPHLGVNFDPANIYVAGDEAYPMAYRRLKPWVRHYHLKDVRLFDAQLSSDHRYSPQEGAQRVGVCTPLGRGAVNMHGLLQALQEDGYAGFLTFELHVPDDMKEQTLQESIAFASTFC